MTTHVQVREADIALSRSQPSLLSNGPIEIAITRATGKKVALTYHEMGTELWLICEPHVSGGECSRYRMRDWLLGISLAWDREKQMAPFDFILDI